MQLRGPLYQTPTNIANNNFHRPRRRHRLDHEDDKQMKTPFLKDTAWISSNKSSNSNRRNDHWTLTSIRHFYVTRAQLGPIPPRK
jgi:hypothetical protein